MKGIAGKPGKGSSSKGVGKATKCLKPTSQMGKGTITGAGMHPYAKKGGK